MKFISGEFDKLTHGQVSNADNIADSFVLIKDGILYYLGRRREFRKSNDEDIKVRLQGSDYLD